MSARVTIVDYGLGNLHSVIKAFRYLGANVEIATDAQGLLAAPRLVVPGVGAFADGMQGLRARGQDAALRRRAAEGCPILGICLGAQLLLAAGEEFGRHEGLGLIAGTVRRIPDQGVKVPHVGWNRLWPPADDAERWRGSLLAATAPGTWAYFIHSYHAVPEDPAAVLAIARHGPHVITAAVRQQRIVGCQFHPEKSGPAGLAMLQAFLAEPA
ncbi:MAG: imidazole glycerol phosphate synthase subunit HisH [Planctomycetota bacterium]|nr:imidazole glycerol phosphate synthase subunit HisH [Planctomycetota bacterium]MCX8040456.1 imidazole glycerol phosphate synthase subunit HisH [Planctomycetota bacterium]MDW8373204.1 imidazole glycerol phosphate synthase subunit HisH [Planctomycetota bacterium]